MSDYWFRIRDFAPAGQVGPKFQVEGVAPTNHFPSQKTRLNDLLYWCKNLDIPFFRFVTMHAFDRQMDRQTRFSLLVPCSAEKV